MGIDMNNKKILEIARNNNVKSDSVFMIEQCNYCEDHDNGICDGLDLDYCLKYESFYKMAIKDKVNQ